MRQISCPTFDDFAQCVLDSYSRLYNGEPTYDLVCVVAPYEVMVYVLRSLITTGCFVPYLLDLDYESMTNGADEFILSIDKDGLLSVEPAFHLSSNFTKEKQVNYIDAGTDSLIYVHEDVNFDFVLKNFESVFVDFDIDEQKDIDDLIRLLKI